MVNLDNGIAKTNLVSSLGAIVRSGTKDKNDVIKDRTKIFTINKLSD